MHVGRTDHGIYLASAPQAFPDDAGEPYLLPVFSAGLIKKDGFTVTPFKSEPATVAPLDGKLICRARSLICETLRVEKKKLSELAKSVKPLFEAAECRQNACAAYRVLYELKRQGVLRSDRARIPGVFDGLSAPVDQLWIEERKLLHKMKLNRLPFEMIKSGQKTFELRLYDEKRSAVATGDLVEFDCEGETLTRRVVAIHRFDSFAELYASLPLTRCGYTEEDVDTADPRDMELYYTPEKQAACGVVAIELAPIN
jgi:ASC-1-like (ASCH) protein